MIETNMVLLLGLATALAGAMLLMSGDEADETDGDDAASDVAVSGDNGRFAVDDSNASANHTIQGSEAFDIIATGSGADEIHGRSSPDTAVDPSEDASIDPVPDSAPANEEVAIALSEQADERDPANFAQIDYLLSGPGDDMVYGGEGVDLIAAGSGDDVVYGGADADVMTDSEHVTPSTATSLVDELLKDQPDDTIINRLLKGDPIYHRPAAQDDDIFYGGGGADDLSSAFGSDLLFGGADDDRLDARDHVPFKQSVNAHDDDSMGDPDERLGLAKPGGFAADRLDGGAGDDLLVGDAGDIFVGGPGLDDFMAGLHLDPDTFSNAHVMRFTDYDPASETLVMSVHDPSGAAFPGAITFAQIGGDVHVGYGLDDTGEAEEYLVAVIENTTREAMTAAVAAGRISIG